MLAYVDGVGQVVDSAASRTLTLMILAEVETLSTRFYSVDVLVVS